ncbi:hypothetical protein SprV_0200771400 [Sparganum proliferum]
MVSTPGHSPINRPLCPRSHTRQHQDWFDENYAPISNLLTENRLHKAFVNLPTDDNKSAFYRSRRPMKQRLQEMQDAWMAHKAEVDKGYADRNAWENVFSVIKAVYGPPTKATAPLNGKTQILQRWAEYFRDVLNHPSIISDATVARLPQVETKADQHRPPVLSPRNHYGCATALQRESARIVRDSY